jgi:hypothetical protein
MRYLLLIYTAETEEPPPDDVAAASHAAYAAFTRDVKERGLFQAGEALTPTSTATTVRVVDGETVTTDGPFAETKEALGGFYLIEARDLDHALDIKKILVVTAHPDDVDFGAAGSVATRSPSCRRSA